ncbi:MAG: hypothetical protein EOP84_17765 [Verrucomicrobiaceae bacterium]|nr:MAG: hypothetical protein EOP84_17765 [Verrucomicrobiaceae bacterium]
MKLRSQFPSMICAVLVAGSVLSTAPVAPLRAQSSLPVAALSPAEEIARLRQENTALREENQRLRQLLIQKQVVAPSAPGVPAERPPSTALTRANTGTNSNLTHWLTLSSRKRHNNRCRYYQGGQGRACTADEGVACKVCGG